MKRALPSLLVCLLTALSIAQTTAKQAFEQLKKLEGTWSGKFGDTDFQVIFKVTGAGSALVETQFPGSDHEMVTVYHMDGKNLLLTHYCAAQNQPRMKFMPSKKAGELAFEFFSGTNMKLMDAHMHNVKYRIKDANNFVSEWGSWDKGKFSSAVKVEMTRTVAK